VSSWFITKQIFVYGRSKVEEKGGGRKKFKK